MHKQNRSLGVASLRPSLMQSRTPIVLFVYNRPGHTRRVLEALARCQGLERCHLVIYSDGPKSPVHEAAVAETRRVVRSWALRFGADVIEQPRNLGLARSIVGGVTHHCATHGRVIVLEDDLVPAPDFLQFMLAGLDRYADDDRVAQISGHLLTDTADVATDGLFLQVMQTWGWATWERAWRMFRWHHAIDPSELDIDPAFRARFTMDGAYKTLRLLQHRLDGEHDTWGILWWYAMAKFDKVTLHPSRSLIWNGGFDKSGVHCSGREVFRPMPPAAFLSPRLSSLIRLPDTVSLDHIQMAATREFLGGPSRSARSPIRLVRLGLKLRRHLHVASASMK